MTGKIIAGIVAVIVVIISLEMEINLNNKKYDLLEEPVKHILLPTKKELHGWYPGKRECTAERLLINPYNGCGIGCFYCYARALPGYFEIFHQQDIIFVAENFDKTVAEQLDSLNIATCGYLSPVTDPFQPLNEKYHLSERIIQVFVERNIPIEFITKAKVPDEVISLIKQQRHSFGQVSILTVNEKLRKILAPNGASVDELLANLEVMAKENVYAVCRIDPIFPYLTDDKKNLTEIVERAKSSGARHIVASILDLPVKIADDILNKIKEYFGAGMKWDYRRLYTERIGYLNAKIDYRKKIFTFLRELCDKKGLTFALCMEYQLVNRSPLTVHGLPIKGLNEEFMSSTNCEGINIPVYICKNGKFQPVTACQGNCLNCIEAKCGIEDLAMGKEEAKKDWKLKDYRRWSEQIKSPTLQLY